MDANDESSPRAMEKGNLACEENGTEVTTAV
jgi:hypothetical protein